VVPDTVRLDKVDEASGNGIASALPLRLASNGTFLSAKTEADLYELSREVEAAPECSPANQLCGVRTLASPISSVRRPRNGVAFRQERM
jgi:hypothetical protein